MPRKKSEKNEEKAEKKEHKEIKKEDVHKKIVELGKTGMTSEKIGLELKKEGIYVEKAKGQRINDVLKSAGIESDADMTNLERDVEKLKKHLSMHKHDFQTKRSLLIKEANLNKIKKLKAQKKR